MRIPWYLRWYVIILSFFLFPIGPLLSVGLMFMRLQRVPSSRSRIGFAMALTNGLMILVWLIGLANDWPGVLCLLGIVFDGIFLGVGVKLMIEGRRGQKYIKLVHQKRLALADDVARAMGRTDVDRVMEEIQQSIDQGWLSGYYLDRVSRRISAPTTPPPQFSFAHPASGQPSVEACPWCGQSRPVGGMCANGHPA